MTSENPLMMLEKWARTQADSANALDKLKALQKIGIPSKNQEAYSYMSGKNLSAYSFPPEDKKNISKSDTLPDNLFKGANLSQVVLINGEYQPRFSILPEGLKIEVNHPDTLNLDPDVYATDYFNYLPEADYFEELADLCCHSPLTMTLKGTFEKPIVILDISIESENRPFDRSDSRVHLELEDAGNATVCYHRMAGPGTAQFQNNFISLNLKRDSTLTWIQSDEFGDKQLNFLRLKTSLARKAKLTAHNFSKASAFSRQNFSAVLREEDADAQYTSTVLLDGSREISQYVNIHHKSPRTFSEQKFNNLLNGKSHCTTDATIVVYPKAYLTQANQLIRNLMLSDDARANTKPNLMIYADEVKCNHGATIGQTDANQLFYLLSRGIEPAQAQWMLNQAAIVKNLEALGDSQLKSIYSDYFKKPL